MQAYAAVFGPETVRLRFFNVFGPRQRADSPYSGVIALFTAALTGGRTPTVFGDGSQTRAFCYVDDLIRGIIGLSESGYHDPVNIGNPNEFTILEAAALIQELTETDSKIVFRPLPQDDPKQRRPEISKARRLLGWEPVVDLRSGLLKTIDFMAKEAGISVIGMPRSAATADAGVLQA